MHLIKTTKVTSQTFLESNERMNDLLQNTLINLNSSYKIKIIKIIQGSN